MTHPHTHRRVLTGSILAIVLLASACGGDDGVAGSDNSTSTTGSTPETTTSTEPASLGELIEFHQFAPGDCFDERLIAGQGQVEIDVEGRIAGDDSTGTTADPAPVDKTEEKFLVECALIHDNEVYFVGEMDEATSTPFPGADAVTEFADSTCFDAFEDYVGQQYELSALEIGYLIPTEESWLLADREVVCFVFSRSGPELEGSVEGLGL